MGERPADRRTGVRERSLTLADVLGEVRQTKVTEKIIRIHIHCIATNSSLGHRNNIETTVPPIDIHSTSRRLSSRRQMAFDGRHQMAFQVLLDQRIPLYHWQWNRVHRQESPERCPTHLSTNSSRGNETFFRLRYRFLLHSCQHGPTMVTASAASASNAARTPNAILVVFSTLRSEGTGVGV